MGTNTTNYSLYKPTSRTEGDWGEEINVNWDTIDTNLKSVSDVADAGGAHATSDGSSHADVATNSTHVAGDGSDHADVATNTTDIATNVTAIGLNTSKVTNATHTGDVTGATELTIGAKKVDVAMLADGTDGELITWDTDGVADTVGAGTADQVLTSNGAGAAPTFQSRDIGKIVQIINTQSAALEDVSVTSGWALDNSKPLNTEGGPVDILDTAVTPTSTSNFLLIEALLHAGHASGSLVGVISIALFRDAGACECAAIGEVNTSVDKIGQVSLRYYVQAPVDTETTYKIRVSFLGSAEDIDVNGHSSGAIFDGALYSSLKITEISA